MQLQITVEEKDLPELVKILESDGLYKPSNPINFELRPELKIFNHPIKVLVTYHEFTVLSDFMDDNQE